jgi:hypothetical protein
MVKLKKIGHVQQTVVDVRATLQNKRAEFDPQRKLSPENHGLHQNIQILDLNIYETRENSHLPLECTAGQRSK